ncbi:MAG: dihydropteroate synthase, partial [Chloroflexota bacterium]|nr:dihydropteroate synthase [Chloroflexota bacterium]
MDLPIGERTLVVGVVNATDDSFSGDGLGDDVGAIRALGERMLTDGADLIDVGAASSRPGQTKVPLELELRRATAAVEALRDLGVPLAIDSTRDKVVEACLRAGARIVNDVSGLSDVRLAELAARHDGWIVLMHSARRPGRRAERDDDPGTIVEAVVAGLRDARERAVRAGVSPGRIVVDPGLGFDKTAAESFALLCHLPRVREVAPVLVGPSRKGHLGVATGRGVRERVVATVAAVACAVMN